MNVISNDKENLQNVGDLIENVKKRIEHEEDNETCTSLYKTLWHAYYRMGSNYFDQGDYNAALQQHLMALELNEYVKQNDVFNLMMSIGVEYEKTSEYDQAIKYYKRLLHFDCIEEDDKTMLLQFIGQCFDKKGEEKTAYDFFNKLFAINRRYDGGWYLFYRYARLAYKYRDFNISQEYFNTTIEIAPENERIYIQISLQHLGYIFLEKEQYEEAIGYFKKALKIKSGSEKVESEILSGLSQAYFGKNNFRKAIKYSMEAIEKPHDDEISERSFFLLAFCYSIKKNKQKQEYYTEKLKTIKPNSPYLREL